MAHDHWVDTRTRGQIQFRWLGVGVLLLLMAVLSGPRVLAAFATADGRIDSGRSYVATVSVLLSVAGSVCLAIGLRSHLVFRQWPFPYCRRGHVLLVVGMLVAIVLVGYVRQANRVDLLRCVASDNAVSIELRHIRRTQGRSQAMARLVGHMQSRQPPRSIRPEHTWDKSAREIQETTESILGGALGAALGRPEFWWRRGESIDWEDLESSVLFELQRQKFIQEMLVAEGPRTRERLEYARAFFRQWLDGNSRKWNSNPWAWNDDTVSNRIQGHMALMECLREWNMCPPDLEEAFLKSLIQHARWLSDPANYNYRTNHGLMQDCALLDIALCYPEFDRGQRWLRTSIERFEERISRTVSENGVFLELTPYYHFLATRKALWFLGSCRSNGLALAPAVETRIRKMVRFCREILQPDGSLPLIADTRPMIVSCPNWPWTSLPDWPEMAELRRTADPAARPACRSGAKLYSGSGYFILRAKPLQGLHCNPLMLTLMAGDVSLAHHHPNKGALTLFAHGRPLLVGPGYPNYWQLQERCALIATPSQNTVSVDNQSQQKGRCEVRFCKTIPLRVPSELSPGFVALQVESRLYRGVCHRRSVFYGPYLDAILIVDELFSSQTHTYRQHFRTAAGLTVCKQADQVEIAAPDLDDRTMLVIESETISEGSATIPEIQVGDSIVSIAAKGSVVVFVTTLNASLGNATEIRPHLVGDSLFWAGPVGELVCSLPLSNPQVFSWSERTTASEDPNCQEFLSGDECATVPCNRGAK